MNRPLVTGQDPNAAAIAAKHFNTATPENDLKWQLVHPQPNQYNWEPADSFVAFCEKNQMVAIGHTLVWHGQTPRWVFQDDAGGAITRDALLARMKDHITTVVGHYKGRIKGWDVVNEALEDNGRLRQNSPWVRIIGEGSEDKKYDFIEKAFQWAHEADPDAELYYNDYNLDTSKAKADAAAAIVKDLKSKGLRIDGVGIQLHGGLTYPKPESLDYAITTLAATGVKVMITELDIKTQTRGPRGADISQVNRESTSDPNAAAAETQKKLADKYAEIFSVLLKHKKDISRVTFWGVYDKTSWIGGSPLLFDRNYQPKEAFFAVVKTASSSSPEADQPGAAGARRTRRIRRTDRAGSGRQARLRRSARRVQGQAREHPSWRADDGRVRLQDGRNAPEDACLHAARLLHRPKIPRALPAARHRRRRTRMAATVQPGEHPRQPAGRRQDPADDRGHAQRPGPGQRPRRRERLRRRRRLSPISRTICSRT